MIEGVQYREDSPYKNVIVKELILLSRQFLSSCILQFSYKFILDTISIVSC